VEFYRALINTLLGLNELKYSAVEMQLVLPTSTVCTGEFIRLISVSIGLVSAAVGVTALSTDDDDDHLTLCEY
jgi:hypothetical protein